MLEWMYYMKAQSSLCFLKATRTSPHYKAIKMALERGSPASFRSSLVVGAILCGTGLKVADAAMDLGSLESLWR